MNEKLRVLIELQAIDTSILSIADKIEALPEKLKKYEDPLKEVTDAFQKFKSKRDVINKKKKDKDHEFSQYQDKIEKLQTRSGDLKTNKEYETHLKEIDNFKRAP